MVRPSAETLVRPLTDSESIAGGDGTDVGDDGTDIDSGGPGGGIAEPPIAEVVEVVSASGSSVELDFDVASWWDITLTDDCTITIVNPPASGLVGLLTIILRQGGAGSFTVTWPAEVEWPDTDGTDGGAAPTLWTVVGARNLIQLITEDGGVSYGGSYDGGGGGGSAIEILNEGVSLTPTAASVDFVGAGVTASAVGDDVTVTIPIPALDDLTDVTITAATTGDRLRYSGSAWVNSAALWAPVMVEDGATGLWYVAVTGDGDAVMTEVS